MQPIHDESDTAIFSGWAYFSEWRESGNFLLLLDALDKVNHAERTWIAARGKKEPMRRHWQVLRRCVGRGLARLRVRLLAARTPAETERALYRGGKRATLARIDRLNDRAIVVALTGASIEDAMSTLAAWGKPRSRGYLKKRASELGLTRRRVNPAAVKAPKSRPRGQPRVSQAVEVSPGRRRHRGTAY